MRNRDVVVISAQPMGRIPGSNALLKEYTKIVSSSCRGQTWLAACVTLNFGDYVALSDKYVTSHTRVVGFGSTCFPKSGSSYIVTLLGMTIQEQDQVAAVLDFVDESYNGYVDRHEALHCTARDGEKHACQMFRLH